MKGAPAMRRLFVEAETRRQGLQYAAAAIVAYATARIVGLPEHLWAVMTTLIVMRPNMASTFEAGFNRVGGTVMGAVFGVAGVASVQQLGVNPQAVTLIAVVALAYVSALSAPLRAAPIAALIILSSSVLPGQSPLLVACLRLAQIVIGIVAALIVSLMFSGFRIGDRLNRGWAKLMRVAAGRLATATIGADAGDDIASDRTRLAIDRLSSLAQGADRISSFRHRRKLDSRRHRRIAALVRHALQDATVLRRALKQKAMPDRSEREVAAIAAAALASAADAIAGQGTADLARLRELAAAHMGNRPVGHADTTLISPLGAPLLLLSQDLCRLCGCASDDAGKPSRPDGLFSVTP